MYNTANLNTTPNRKMRFMKDKYNIVKSVAS
jgi:hypothetical protein